MDWTNVFNEHGDEDFLISQKIEHAPKAPRLARLVSRLYHQHNDELMEQERLEMSEHRLFEVSAFPEDEDHHRHHEKKNPYSLKALYYLSINYILGVGCLGVPYAFARAGFVLCTSVLLVVTLCSYMTVMWVAETGERYHTFCQRKKTKSQDAEAEQRRQQDRQRQDVLLSEGSATGYGDPNQMVGSTEQSPLLSRRMSPGSETASVDIHEQHCDRYEVVDLVGFYLGPVHKTLYQIALMALMYIGLLAYSQVFCGALAELLWGSKNSPVQGLTQFVFGCMVVPLSCFELDEQIGIQALMAIVRFIAIFIMVFGSLLALFLDDSHVVNSLRDSEKKHGPPYWAPSEPSRCQMSYTICLSGFGVAFSTSLFSQLFQHSVPGLLRPLRDQPTKHKKIPKTLGASLLTTTFFYFLLGTSAASFFGASTRSSVNLNFANFTMGLDGATTPRTLLIVVRIAAGVVVIFPALDTVSVFPLIAATLGNNLWAVAVSPRTIKWWARYLFRQDTALMEVQRTLVGVSDNERSLRRISRYEQLPADDQRALIERASRLFTILWRLVAALPPLLGSIIADDLSFSLLLAGVAGVYVAFFAPSLCQLKSTSHESPTTIFHGWYSAKVWCYPVLLFASFSLCTVLVQIREAWEKMHEEGR